MRGGILVSLLKLFVVIGFLTIPFYGWSASLISSSITRTLNVNTEFVQSRFYDKQILDFRFVIGDWTLKNFNYSEETFAPITDTLLLNTNLPMADISSESYKLKLIVNNSQCRTSKGNVGSTDFVTVSVDGNTISEGGGASIKDKSFAFQGAGKTGLYSKHAVNLTFDKLDVQHDESCDGTIRMSVELNV